ncbi:MAG: N-(5'-phosphoribosyl)anthranilate isomerase [Myxococcales bacterium]|nr:N-(5'-phosphoribosyl)anthranilate isomerase [Myxococcales bacterium]
MTDLAQSSAPTIKVCGITRIEDAKSALSAGATMLGFVLVPESPRGIPAQAASAIIQELPEKTPTVAVVGTISAQEARDHIRTTGASHIQLCGAADPADFAEFPVPIFRRIPVDTTGIAQAERWSEQASGFVLDHPSGMGGTGQVVDLSLGAELAQRFPCLLAGGLKPENVAQAISAVRPLGVDASSGLEQSAGIKDTDRVQRFVQQARDAFDACWPLSTRF